jgi:hypothetical protein
VREVSDDKVISCHPDADADYLCAFAGNGTRGSEIGVTQKLALLQASGFDVVALQSTLQAALDDAAKTSVDSLYPSSDYMYAFIGTAFAFLTSVYLAVTFLPSITSTILQLRSGVIPTLNTKDFNKFRVATNQFSILTGSMFWGCFISSVLVGSFDALLVFICLWQVSS